MASAAGADMKDAERRWFAGTCNASQIQLQLGASTLHKRWYKCSRNILEGKCFARDRRKSIWFVVNVTKIILIRCQIYHLNCTKFNFRLELCSRPRRGAHSTPHTSSWLWGKGKEKGRKRKKRGKGGAGERGVIKGGEEGRGKVRKGRVRGREIFLHESEGDIRHCSAIYLHLVHGTNCHHRFLAFLLLLLLNVNSKHFYSITLLTNIVRRPCCVSALTSP